MKKYDEEEFLNSLYEQLADIVDTTNNKALSIISSRINSIGKMSATDANRLSILVRNKDIKEIESIILKSTKKSSEEITKIFDSAAEMNDTLAEKMYLARDMKGFSIAENTALIGILEVAKKNTIDNVLNLSGTAGFMVNGKVTSIAKAYNYSVNRAIFEVNQGLFDYNTAMRSTIRELASNGLVTVDFDSGYKRRLDSQVRMNVLDGVRQTNIEYRNKQAEQFEADMVFVSLHNLCAQDHQFINGQNYAKKDWERISSGLARQVGELNCRHYLTYGIQGISENPYSETERKKAISDSNRNVEYDMIKTDKNGNVIKKTLTRYDFTQVQREVETDIRRLKGIKNQFDISGDAEMSKLYQKKIKEKSTYYKKISQQAGIQTQPERIRIVK